MIRALIAERTDPVLFELSYDYVGDLSETVALMWPADPAQARRTPSRRCPRSSRRSSTLGKAQLPAQLARWLDALDETGRWALLKLVTGGLRIGVSARLAKTAVAALGGKEPNEIELLWPGLAPPYTELFAWLEGRADKPVTRDPAPFRPAMLAHAIEDTDFAALDPARLHGRVEMGRHPRAGGRGRRRRRPRASTRLYSRTGEDISKSFPDLVEALRLRRRDRRRTADRARRPRAVVQRAAAAAQPQSRHAEAARRNFPRICAPTICWSTATRTCASCRSPSGARGSRRFVAQARRSAHRSLAAGAVRRPGRSSTAARADPAAAGAGADADAVEGVMLKRRDAPYVPGRPKGLWWKWKRDPLIVDAVLMYAQRGHGKRSSFYSDYTFGVWTEGEDGDELVPVGKAYFGFTDEELLQIDRFVRRNTIERFGPVREVTHEPDQGLVFEVAFEGLQRSTRHKSGVAMRFPRISRLRWDKPPREADRLETLEKMLAKIESGRGDSRRRHNRACVLAPTKPRSC